MKTEGPRRAVLLLCGLTLVLPTAVMAAPAPANAPVPLRLADCLRIAFERQPSLSAPRQTLASAESRAQALDDLPRAVAVLRRDLAVRRLQAHKGVESARAGLARAEANATSAVTRTYFAVQYARAQLQVTKELVAELTFTRKRVGEALKKRERAGWTTVTLDLVTLYLNTARARQVEAESGLGLATAALREAMGLEPGACFTVAEEPLPDPAVKVCLASIMALALERRGELRQALLGAEVTELEAEAQAHTCRPGTVYTFAAGADIHSELMLRGISHRHYQPAVLSPLMPVTLSGSKAARIEVARELAGHSRAVATKARNLIALEAEATYLRWQEASRRVVLYREANLAGTRVFKFLGLDLRGGFKGLIENTLVHTLLATQARAALNEALFDKVVALAELERITGGGFHAGLLAPAPRSR